MNKNSGYKLAVALLQFKTAYKNLTDISMELPDEDLTEQYPFYLLDFEGITDAVQQWCTTHAARLMKNLPDRVDNPACLKCDHFRCGLSPSNMCTKGSQIGCTVYPFIPFTREAVTPYLSSLNIDVTGWQDGEVQLTYMRKADKTFEEKKI